MSRAEAGEPISSDMGSLADAGGTSVVGGLSRGQTVSSVEIASVRISEPPTPSPNTLYRR